MKDFITGNLEEIEFLDRDVFVKRLSGELSLGAGVLSYFSVKYKEGIKLFVFLLKKSGEIEFFSCKADSKMPSLTPFYPQLHLFEREISEKTGIIFEGHPLPNPVRYENGLTASSGSYFKVQGNEIHEVAVGPVHAGVIEPGHFRFQCLGENVFHLQIELGYQHRGIENAVISVDKKRMLPMIETAAGDTSIGHAWTYAKITEALCEVQISKRASFLRGAALELERLANHIGDLGALSGDVAYLPTANFCGRIRGEILNITALLCGNRFGRNFIIPGGVEYDVDDKLIKEIMSRLDSAYEDAVSAISLLWERKTVLDRFEKTGIVSLEKALKLRLVGPAGRASGIDCDLRKIFKSEPYEDFESEPLTLNGDVFSRAYIRWMEIKKSYKLIKNWLSRLPQGEITLEIGPFKKNSFALALTEGWRGEICHVCFTDDKGEISFYKIKDPSFHNWQGLAMALRNAQISDFPLCNKSFNLSYCGHDL
ncbi:MAG: hydrogenase [Elusimicrobia bacterium]|nr:hydrogenase [Elusimicrobiota bacterium]